MTEQDFYWLIGLLEGEGSFQCGPPSAPNLPRITLHMTDEDVVARVALFWQQTYHLVQQARSEKYGWKPSYFVHLRGRAAITLMKMMQPHMSKRRQEQISRVIASYNPHMLNKLSPGQIQEIKAKILEGHKHTELAKQYGVDRSTISHIKAGARAAYR